MSETTDIRDEMHAHIQPGVQVFQTRVWELLGKFGPCTTRQLAESSGMSLLTVRPRVTELLELGLVELSGRLGREGVYRQVAITTIQKKLAEEAHARSEQREFF